MNLILLTYHYTSPKQPDCTCADRLLLLMVVMLVHVWWVGPDTHMLSTMTVTTLITVCFKFCSSSVWRPYYLCTQRGTDTDTETHKARYSFHFFSPQGNHLSKFLLGPKRLGGSEQ